jgi:hypothetical protein
MKQNSIQTYSFIKPFLFLFSVIGLEQYPGFGVHYELHIHLFLGTFAKLRKATIKFVVSFRPSIFQRGTTRLSLDGFFKMKFGI